MLDKFVAGDEHLVGAGGTMSLGVKLTREFCLGVLRSLCTIEQPPALLLEALGRLPQRRGQRLVLRLEALECVQLPRDTRLLLVLRLQCLR